MSKKLFKTLAFVLAISCLLSTAVFADTIGGGTVKANGGLNLRSGASTSSSVSALIPDGSFIIVEENLGGWYKVNYNGVSGYVHGGYVSFASVMDGAFGGVGTVSGTNVRFRAGASTSSAILGEVNTGDSLSILGVSGQWLHVRSASGTEGYVHGDYVSLSPSTVGGTLPSVSTAGDALVNTAMNYLGCRYVWGGMSPSGFDCSGLVNYVYKLHGYSLYRVAQDIYSKNGTWVDKASLRPGDLVFFGYGPYSITHVGMYIGGGRFIHASSSDTGVIISELSSNYYTRMYVGAKRIVN